MRRVTIAHKLGSCPIGEASVVIAVSAAHRREAIEAVHFAIDELKRTVPIWKKVAIEILNMKLVSPKDHYSSSSIIFNIIIVYQGNI